jgi:two-component system, cell cycle sensor histidine kinase and response regulator CckA
MHQASSTSEIVILLAEDEVMVRNLVQQILMAEGFQVLAAADGQEAAELFRRCPNTIHMLLTDVNMPKLSGFRLAQQIRLEKPRIKIMFMCGNWNFPGDALPANVIMKPFGANDLVAKVREALDAPPEPW